MHAIHFNISTTVNDFLDNWIYPKYLDIRTLHVLFTLNFNKTFDYLLMSKTFWLNGKVLTLIKLVKEGFDSGLLSLLRHNCPNVKVNGYTSKGNDLYGHIYHPLHSRLHVKKRIYSQFEPILSFKDSLQF